ncbi:MAG: TolC family protein [Pirellulales bacterium]
MIDRGGIWKAGLIAAATLLLAGCASTGADETDSLGSLSGSRAMPAPAATDAFSFNHAGPQKLPPVEPASHTEVQEAHRSAWFEPDRAPPSTASPAPATPVLAAGTAGTHHAAEPRLAYQEQAPESVPHTQSDGVQSSYEALEPVPIDLSSALQQASGRNPQISFAQQRVEEAFAELRTAEVLWVPSLRAGVNYNKHEGRIQDVEGNIIDTSRGSIYAGFGAQAVGAGSPAVPGLVMNFHLTDAVFQPRIAAHTLGAQRHASRAVVNDTLVDTAIAYIDLLEALQIEAVANQTLVNAQSLVELTRSFAETGQGLLADADRANVELSIRQIELRRASEAARVASVRLTRLLSQDQTLPLAPIEPALVPIELITDEQPLSELVSIGLANRPELAESQFLVGEAIQRLRRERYAPLVPSVLLGLSYGGNGGGLGSEIINFGDRLDLDAAAYWEVRNLGFAERSIRNAANSQVEQARWRQVAVMDQVAGEIAEAHAQAVSTEAQIEMAQAAIGSARDSYRRNNERIRNGQGLPIEALQSLQALDQSQRQYVRSVADFNRAQFRLYRALGWPIP